MNTTTTTTITPFLFGESTIRTMNLASDPWFCGKDVCDALAITNNRDAISSLDEDEKITVANTDGNPRAGIPHEMTFVNESGLYSLIFKSRKTEAKIFKKWVTSEVLPSIRKRGFYSHRTDQLLSFVRELMDMGATFKEASILARGEFPPLSKREREKQFLIVEAAETGDPGPADPDGDLFLSIMHPGQQYRVADFFAVVPAHHWLLKKNERGRETAIGSILGRLCRLGKIRRVLKARHATYELPAKDNVVSIK